MSDPAQWSRLAGALALGLGRQPLPEVAGLGLEALDEPARALALTALLAQRLRLAAPGAPASEAQGRRLPDDPRPMLPAPARDALRRLDRRLDADGRRRLAPLILGAVAGAGHRLHIFDLPTLEPLLRAAPAGLGPVERAWLGREPEAVGGDDGASTLPGGRLAALREGRRTDPAGARRDLAASLAGEPAKLRAELVASLAIGLAAEDRALLETCLADRAQGVRDAATALLARLPGSPAYDDRLASARATLSVEARGLLRRHRRLTFKPPRQMAENRVALFQLFDGFTLSALIAGSGLGAADLPEAAAQSQAALPILARAAILEGEHTAAVALLAQVAEPKWPGDLLNLLMDWSVLDARSRGRLVADTFRPDVQLGAGHDLYRLTEFLGGALDPMLAARLLASPALAARLAQVAAQAEADEKADIDLHLLPLVAITPPATARALAAALAPISTARRPKSSALIALLEQLARLAPGS
jgi:hypothetical protein